MPFTSEAQRRFMYARHPKLAKEFEAKTPKGKRLPEHADDPEHKKRMHAEMNRRMRSG